MVHGEVTDPAVDVFDREAAYIDRVLVSNIIHRSQRSKLVCGLDFCNVVGLLALRIHALLVRPFLVAVERITFCLLATVSLYM